LGFSSYFMNFPIETDSATPPQFMTNNLDRAENWREVLPLALLIDGSRGRL